MNIKLMRGVSSPIHNVNNVHVMQHVVFTINKLLLDDHKDLKENLKLDKIFIL